MLARDQTGIHAVEPFGVAQEQKPVVFQKASESSDHMLLSRAVKVDHDVSAKNGVEASPNRPGIVQKIESAKCHQILNLRTNADKSGLRPSATQKMSS